MGRHLRRRMLEETIPVAAITLKAATDAWGVKKEYCVQDVTATGDLEVADDPAHA